MRPFLGFATALEAIAEATNAEKVRLGATLLAGLPAPELETVVRWLAPPAGPMRAAEPEAVWALLRGPLGEISAVSDAELRDLYLRYNDAGEAAAALWVSRGWRATAPEPGAPLTLAEVREWLALSPPGTPPRAGRKPWLDLLRRARAEEVRCLARLAARRLRLGLQGGTLEALLAAAFRQPQPLVARAVRLLGDFAAVARLAREGRLHDAAVTPFHPAPPSPEPLEPVSPGLRLQWHRVGQRVAVFDATGKEVTGRFPALRSAVAGLHDDLVVEVAVTASEAGRALSELELSQRPLGSDLEPTLGLDADLTVRFTVVDLLWLGGVTWLDAPPGERLAALQRIAFPPPIDRVSPGSPESPHHSD